MARLVMAEFRKLISTRMWRWVLLTSVVWTVTYTAIAIAINNHPGRLVPSLSSAAGQHALFATAAGFAGTLVAVMATAEVAGEYRHASGSRSMSGRSNSRVTIYRAALQASSQAPDRAAKLVAKAAGVAPWDEGDLSRNRDAPGAVNGKNRVRFQTASHSSKRL